MSSNLLKNGGIGIVYNDIYMSNEPLRVSSKHATIVLFEIVIGIVLSLASLVLFAIITRDVLQLQTLQLDTSLSQAVYTLRTPLLTHVMIIVSFLGADFIVLGAGIVTVLLAWKKHKHEAILLLTILATGLFVNIILKTLLQRTRPEFDPILDLSSSYSFPSGHAMNSFIFYSLMAYFVYHFTHNTFLSITAATVSIIIILFVGFSRVYLGVHYPSDVLAGYIAGFFVFITAIVIQQSFAIHKT